MNTSSNIVEPETASNRREHIVLLGDSILDNESYVRSRSVIDQLQNKCQVIGWTATNCAIDGALIGDIIPEQIDHIPLDVSTIVISAGGNDCLSALNHMNRWQNWLPWNFIYLLNKTKNSMISEYIALIHTLREKFPNASIICCTLYYPVFDDEMLIQAVSNIGVNFIANAIIYDLCRNQFHNIPVIDLRYVFNERRDYANSIEPGVCGGDKITNNIMNIVKGDFAVDNVYKLNEYSSNFNAEKYSKTVWVSLAIDRQKGNYATKFFRRAFNERENTNIKFYTKGFAICCGIGVLYACWKYKPKWKFNDIFVKFNFFKTSITSDEQ